MSSSAGLREHRAAYLGIVGTTLLVLAVVLGLGLSPHPGSSGSSGSPGGATSSERSGVPAAAEAPTAAEAPGAPGADLPQVGHVFVVNIENKGFGTTWGAHSRAPYLAKTLRAKGILLKGYYATAHHSLPNYLAQISGQGPNPTMQADCQTFSNFDQTGTTAPQQAQGSGCVFPKGVRSLPTQMSRNHLSWKGYMEDLPRPCYHPKVGSQDPTQKATAKSQYATRHNPFVYFHSIINRHTYCKRHVVGLGHLKKDLGSARHTPALAYITPDLCSDGHDENCADGRPGGLKSVNAWMKVWVPRILQSPAFKTNGLLIITADESDSPQSDSTACCDETAVNTPQAGIVGPGGGLIGALLISPYITPDTWSTTPYNHYSLLGSLAEIYGLKKIGYARTVPDVFGLDVYNSGWNE